MYVLSLWRLGAKVRVRLETDGVCVEVVFCLLWAVFLRVDCACNRPSYFATVFYGVSAFNGDLNQWNVASVTTMRSSKSIRTVENVLT
jgi:surface protein